MFRIVEHVTLAFELVGIAIIVAGAVFSILRYASAMRSAPNRARAYRGLRSDLGRSILLGLEFLVAADIINTVAIEPTLQSVAVLAGIVAIRTVLSISLEVEIEGRWPWQGASVKRE